MIFYQHLHRPLLTQLHNNNRAQYKTITHILSTTEEEKLACCMSNVLKGALGTSLLPI